MKWGILDTQDDCWLGDEKGPKLFTNHGIARMAAQMAEMQVFGTDFAGRYQAKEFEEQPLRLRDQVDTKMSAIDALGRLEGGRLQ